MSGFTLRNLDNKGAGLVSRIQRNIRYLASLGMKWDHELLQQSKSAHEQSEKELLEYESGD